MRQGGSDETPPVPRFQIETTFRYESVPERRRYEWEVLVTQEEASVNLMCDIASWLSKSNPCLKAFFPLHFFPTVPEPEALFLIQQKRSKSRAKPWEMVQEATKQKRPSLIPLFSPGPLRI